MGDGFGEQLDSSQQPSEILTKRESINIGCLTPGVVNGENISQLRIPAVCIYVGMFRGRQCLTFTDKTLSLLLEVGKRVGDKTRRNVVSDSVRRILLKWFSPVEQQVGSGSLLVLCSVLASESAYQPFLLLV